MITLNKHKNNFKQMIIKFFNKQINKIICKRMKILKQQIQNDKVMDLVNKNKRMKILKQQI